MTLEYTYEIKNVNAEFKCMEIEFNSIDKKSILVGAPLPISGTDLDTHIRNYAPIRAWLEEDVEYVIPVVGTTGSFSIIDQISPINTEAQKLIDANIQVLIQQELQKLEGDTV